MDGVLPGQWMAWAHRAQGLIWACGVGMVERVAEILQMAAGVQDIAVVLQV